MVKIWMIVAAAIPAWGDPRPQRIGLRVSMPADAAGLSRRHLCFKKQIIFDRPAGGHAAGKTSSARKPPTGAVESVRLPP
jgi:hypothetical protein